MDNIHRPHSPASIVKHPVFVTVNIRRQASLAVEFADDKVGHGSSIVAVGRDRTLGQAVQFIDIEDVEPVEVLLEEVIHGQEEAENGEEFEPDAFAGGWFTLGLGGWWRCHGKERRRSTRRGVLLTEETNKRQVKATHLYSLEGFDSKMMVTRLLKLSTSLSGSHQAQQRIRALPLRKGASIGYPPGVVDSYHPEVGFPGNAKPCQRIAHPARSAAQRSQPGRGTVKDGFGHWEF